MKGFRLQMITKNALDFKIPDIESNALDFKIY